MFGPKGELLLTYYAAKLRVSGARRTRRTCLLLDAKLGRSQRFLEAPKAKLKHWRGFPSIFGLETAPNIEFHLAKSRPR